MRPKLSDEERLARHRASKKRYKQKHRDKVNLKRRENYSKNIDKCREYSYQASLKNKEQRKEYREKNKDKIKKLSQSWWQRSHQQVKQKRLIIRTILIAYLGGKCEHCSSKDQLEFDHINPFQKKYEIIKYLYSPNKWQDIEFMKEINKCQLLCEKCHYIKSGNERRKKLTHGTYTGYSYYKCRCSLCKIVKYNKDKQYRLEKQQKLLRSNCE